MPPRDLWDANPVHQLSFSFHYIDEVWVRGLGFEDPFPIYEDMVSVDWVEPVEPPPLSFEIYEDPEEEAPIQEVINWLHLHMHGNSVDDPIDLTQD